MDRTETDAPALEEPSDSVLDDALRAAEEAKAGGNALLKQHSKAGYDEAVEKYSAGILALEQAATHVHKMQQKAKEADPDAVVPLSEEYRMRGGVLLSVLFSNRAHVKMLTKDFVGCVDDARRAFGLDSGNVKAYWRASKASLHLQLYRNAHEFADVGLGIDPDNEELKKLVAFCTAKLGAFDKAKKRDNVEYSAEEASQLQQRVNELRQQQNMVTMELQQTQRESAKGEVVKAFLDTQPADAVAYRKIGRLFKRSNVPDLAADLEKQVAEAKKQCPKLTQVKVDLEKRCTSAEEDLGAMVQAFKRQYQRQLEEKNAGQQQQSA